MNNNINKMTLFSIKKMLIGLSGDEAQAICEQAVQEHKQHAYQGMGLMPSIVKQCANTFRKSKGLIENDKEVEDCILSMPYLAQTEMRIVLINKFGAKRTPSKATLNRYLMKQKKTVEENNLEERQDERHK